MLMETVNNLFISIQFLSKLIVPAVLHSFWSTIRKEEKTEVKKKTDNCCSRLSRDAAIITSQCSY